MYSSYYIGVMSDSCVDCRILPSVHFRDNIVCDSGLLVVAKPLVTGFNARRHGVHIIIADSVLGYFETRAARFFTIMLESNDAGTA